MNALASMPLGETLVLAEGYARVEIAPQCGARILSFECGGVPVLRAVHDRNAKRPSPYDFAGFPLLPYSGPLFAGGFFFDGEFYDLERNVAAEADATHGDAWINSWSVEDSAANFARLSFDYAPGPERFPFPWAGSLIYRVDAAALVVDIALRNTGNSPMPAGMGFHPYFPRPEATGLTFAHGAIWPPDSPSAVKSGPALIDDLDFSRGRDLTGMVLDRCFEDWPGVAHLDYSDGRRVSISATPSFGKMQIYVPWYDPYVCVEPVSNANDGFNRRHFGVAGHGVVVLAPGETLSGSIRIAVGSWHV